MSSGQGKTVVVVKQWYQLADLSTRVSTKYQQRLVY